MPAVTVPDDAPRSPALRDDAGAAARNHPHRRLAARRLRRRRRRGRQRRLPPSCRRRPAPPVVVLPTRTEAARFLSQASMGSSRADIDQVAAIGFAAWLDQQFATPRTISHWDWLVRPAINDIANRDNEHGFDPVMWRQLIASPDQLRVRVGMALLDFLVVGISGVNLSWRQFAIAAYVDLLMDNAFGNFRTLLDAASRPTRRWASFLTFLGNRRANAATGAVPDENYARELHAAVHHRSRSPQRRRHGPDRRRRPAARDLHAGRHHRPRPGVHRLEPRFLRQQHAGPLPPADDQHRRRSTRPG